MRAALSVRHKNDFVKEGLKKMRMSNMKRIEKIINE